MKSLILKLSAVLLCLSLAACGQHSHSGEHHHDDMEEHHHEGEGHHHHHHHHADDVFTSWGLETPKLFAEDELRGILDKLQDEGSYGMILRAKGIIPTTDGTWIHFDYTPGEIDIRRGGAEVTGRLCVIGSKLNEDAIKECFGV